MEQPVNLSSQNVYEITIRGEIAVSWIMGFDEVDVQTEIIAVGEQQSTLFRIVTDQAGLVGLIRRLHGVGVVLVAVRQASRAEDSVQT